MLRLFSFYDADDVLEDDGNVFYDVDEEDSNNNNHHSQIVQDNHKTTRRCKSVDSQA
jgi:hypothetical protein